MKSLREFELQSTQVSKLPDCMLALPKLEKINVRWSKVTEDTIAALKALRAGAVPVRADGGWIERRGRRIRPLYSIDPTLDVPAACPVAGPASRGSA